MLELNYQENGLTTARLLLRKDGFLDHLRSKGSVISITPTLSNECRAVETFITRVYAQSYQANIRVRYRTLMSVRNADGEILAAVGFRPAQSEPLFLEQYLSAPIDHLLAVPRTRIVEIGNLASAGGGASSFLFAALSAYLHHKGFEHAVITGTESLGRRFARMGLRPQWHGSANPEKLSGDCDDDWGGYYNARPQILSGSVAHGYRRLQRVLGAEYRDMRPRLFPRLHYRNDGHPLS